MTFANTKQNETADCQLSLFFDEQASKKIESLCLNWFLELL